ncbi:Phosphate transport system permease protein PstC [Methylacidimicrobium cyclopophantes]|uniref:Phosphate transport system permease protein n=1 Tax=Methylacidimicrobium cyclopophantes TaxID=1041766 RepID=A0A5E6MRG2_9BACT|nr:phosphate ABC transporter permease subunit PstC [Methylacidimicrobium cyclopophantes]VVM08498.1 Phosphate transport system permease protein PstC [Methylacidimicrobium cyclopophantes]
MKGRHADRFPNEPFRASAALRNASFAPGWILDKGFGIVAVAMGISVFVLAGLLGWELYRGAEKAISRYGMAFLTGSQWDPVAGRFGALPFLYGTFLSSAIALLLAFPLSVATALFLTELAPVWLRRPVLGLIDIMAAVPSVVWGLWAMFEMVPWLRQSAFPFLQKAFHWLPFFQGPIYGVSLLAGALVIAIMITPIITSLAIEILRSVPPTLREAAWALGATRWEVIQVAVLPYGRSALVGAGVLGLGRALGETMAVTMVIGNRPEILLSLFAPGYTLASVLVNEFAEATSEEHLSALFAIGLTLVAVTLIVNFFARLLIHNVPFFFSPRPLPLQPIETKQ